MGNVKLWTKEEDDILIDMYGKHTYAEIMKSLKGRTKKAIEGRLTRIGLLGKYDRQYLEEKYKTINNKLYKKCKTCGKYLPSNELYYPRDLKLEEGIRNVCKRCKGENYNIQFRYNLTEEQENYIIDNYESLPNQEIVDNMFDLFYIKLELNNIHKIIETLRKNKKLTVYKLKEVSFIAQHYSENAIRGQKRNSERLKKLGKWKGSDNPFYNSNRVGCLNPKWDGGKTSLYNELRTQIQDWKNNSMIQCNYRCILSGDKFSDIHHLYPYKDILDECFSNLNMTKFERVENYNEVEFNKIVDEINRLHSIYPLGVCLRKDIHALFHDNYGYFNNTPEQFYEFALENYNIDIKEKLNLK